MLIQNEKIFQSSLLKQSNRKMHVFRFFLLSQQTDQNVSFSSAFNMKSFIILGLYSENTKLFFMEILQLKDIIFLTLA